MLDQAAGIFADMEPIVLRDAGDLSALEAGLATREPFVVRGLAEHWPLTQAAKTSSAAARSFLSERQIQRPFVVTLGPAEMAGHIFYDENMVMNITTERMPLDACLDRMAEAEAQSPSPTVYLGSIDMHTHFQGLAEEHSLDLGPRNPLASIWIGTRTRVSAHNDFPDNIACVVGGRRRFVLFPPDQFRNLYLGPIDNTPAGRPVSLVDFHNPDFERFPRFRDALQTARIAELEPGDAIFIPSMWWHHVEALDAFNILVNFWWRDTPAHLGLPQDALNHAIMSIRDLPAEDRALWREMFDHYVFDADDSVTAHIPERGRGILGPMTQEMASRIRTYILRIFSQ
ncbi:cupin-like domain-containing protein [Maricaulis parjimensis]|uniref:cupin-like domain-containing protein n=1 Tax=Maricaulis parjimensis TaxID=144023 RepID=UPI00193ACEC0|nr:cupin-like domain-containing protein [Maricaulis parjimensis]